VGLTLFALPYIRRRIFEVFLRTHQVLAYVLLYATWRHVPSGDRLSRICNITTIVLLSIALLLQLGFLIYRNRIFSLHGWPRVRVSCNRPKIEEKDDSDVIIQVRVALTRPVRIEAGQYINLWMPSVTWWSWTQVHPFMVTSWSHSAQETLDILIQPQCGFSRELLKHARAAPQGSALLRAFIIGPHGMSENVDRYESVVLVVNGFGIAAAIPYLKKLVYSYNTSASRTRRVHLVWEVENLGEYRDVKWCFANI
jgi:FAD-binding domain/Ferric reductase NAD binding domain